MHLLQVVLQRRSTPRDPEETGGGSDNNLLLGMLLMRICKFKFYYCCWERCRYCYYYRCYLSLFLVPPPQLVAELRHISVVQLDAWASLILRYLQNQLMVKPT